MAQPPVEGRRVEAALHGVVDHGGLDPPTTPLGMGQSRAEPVHRISEQQQEAGVGRSPPQQLGDPRQREIVRRPLATSHSRRAWEPAVVAPDLRVVEPERPEPVEEVPLLVDARSRRDLRVGRNEVVPPGRPAFLSPDPDEVGWTWAFAGQQLGRGEVEAGLPGGVATQPMEDVAAETGREKEERLPPPGCHGHPLPQAVTAAGCHRRDPVTRTGPVVVQRRRHLTPPGVQPMICGMIRSGWWGEPPDRSCRRAASAGP